MIKRKMSIPLIALLLGIGIVTTQSAFKRQVNDPNWGYDATNNTFVNIEGRTMDNSEEPASGTYSCLDEGICAGYYEGVPSSTGDLEDTEDGNFQLNP